ncbi:MAG: hypothetical protein FJY85_18965 [Deltaproteobacteria bacterium]|nr:hypothetical protein [Deltaproteobacteria bacterium]
MTGQATNFPTFSLRNIGSAGAGTVDLASLAFSSTGVTAASRAPAAMTLNTTAANLEVASGETVLFKILQTASGKVYPKVTAVGWFEYQ